MDRRRRPRGFQLWRSWAGLRSRQRSGEYCYWISLFIFPAPLSLWTWSSPYWPCGSSGLALLNAGRGGRIREAGIANRQGTCGPMPSNRPGNITRRMARCETANGQGATLHFPLSPTPASRRVQRKSARGRLRRFSWRRRGKSPPSRTGSGPFSAICPAPRPFRGATPRANQEHRGDNAITPPDESCRAFH